MTRAVTSAATFLVAPGQAQLQFKTDSAVTSAASFDHFQALRKLLVLFSNEVILWNITVKHAMVKHLYEAGIKHVQPLLQLLGIFPSYSLLFVKICI